MVFALFESRTVKILGILVFGLVQTVVQAVKRATMGPELMERTSAAQFPDNSKKLEKAVPKATTQ